MFERFTDEARRALTVAQEEARRLDHDFIGTEHLLLGLLGAGDSMAVAALIDVGVTLDEARASVEERVHPARAASHGAPPFTPLAKKALERSLRAALTLNDSSIGPEHVLLGLIDVPDGGGAQVLADLAVSLDQVREAVLTHLGKSLPAPPKREGGTRRSRMWITRGGAAASSEIASAGPRCPSCKASLVENLRYRVVDVSAAAESEVRAVASVGTSTGTGPDEPQPDPALIVPITETMTVTVVFCGQCGAASGLA